MPRPESMEVFRKAAEEEAYLRPPLRVDDVEWSWEAGPVCDEFVLRAKLPGTAYSAFVACRFSYAGQLFCIDDRIGKLVCPYAYVLEQFKALRRHAPVPPDATTQSATSTYT